MHFPPTLLAPVRCASILALAGYLLVPADARCQGLYNEADLHVDGASIYVDGEINNTGNLTNEGLVSFTGDWESAGKYSGNGELEIRGNISQKILHRGQDVHTVRIDGWGPKYVKGRLNITQALHLKQGIVHVSQEDAFRLEAGVVITGGHESSFVDGAITVAGTGYKFFPLGKNGTYAPIEFLNVKGQTAEYAVEVFEDAPAVAVENVIVRRALYWQRRDLYGDFGGSAVAIGFNASNYADPKNIMLLSGTDWDEPFIAVSDIEHSVETHKISTTRDIFASLILVGEISEKWNEADFYFSTALSPNAAHAENRTVRIFGERLSEDNFHFQVFDRWGKLVYESVSRKAMGTNGWDGRAMNGRELAGGTYPYRLSGVDKMGAKLEKKGVITIIH
jgi:hypothetical protein